MNSSIEILTFKERLELYKIAKKPRKQVRLKLQIITNGLNLPKMQNCASKVKQVFRMQQTNKIQPQINEYVEKQTEIRKTRNLSRKQSITTIRKLNRMHALKTALCHGQQRLKLNQTLTNLYNEVHLRTQTVGSEQ